MTPQGMVLMAGVAVIAVGVVCLYLSDAVVHGWWQGTLDAFGVGFVVGGVVDVLALSGLTWAVAAEQGRRAIWREGDALLYGSMDPPAKAAAIRKFLAANWIQLYPELSKDLYQAVLDIEGPQVFSS